MSGRVDTTVVERCARALYADDAVWDRTPVRARFKETVRRDVRRVLVFVDDPDHYAGLPRRVCCDGCGEPTYLDRLDVALLGQDGAGVTDELYCRWCFPWRRRVPGDRWRPAHDEVPDRGWAERAAYWISAPLAWLRMLWDVRVELEARDG